MTLTARALAKHHKLVIWGEHPSIRMSPSASTPTSLRPHITRCADKHQRIHQELADDISRAILADRSGIFVDVTDKIVKNAVAGVDDNDLVTLSRAQTMLGSSGSVDAAKTAAEAAADAAQSAYAALVAQSSQPGFTLTQYTQVMDDISGLFDGVSTTFPLTIGGTSKVPATAAQILVFLGGVYQTPTTSYTVADDQITFSDPPATGMSARSCRSRYRRSRRYWRSSSSGAPTRRLQILAQDTSRAITPRSALSPRSICPRQLSPAMFPDMRRSVFGSSSTIKACVSLVSLADQNNWIQVPRRRPIQTAAHTAH